MSKLTKKLTRKQIDDKLKIIEQSLPADYRLGEDFRNRLNKIKLSSEAKEKISNAFSIGIPVGLTALFIILGIYRHEYLIKYPEADYLTLIDGIISDEKKSDEVKSDGAGLKNKTVKKKVSYNIKPKASKIKQKDKTEQFLKYIGIPIASVLGAAILGYFGNKAYKTHKEYQRNKEEIDDLINTAKYDVHIENSDDFLESDNDEMDDYTNNYNSHVFQLKSGGKLDLSDPKTVEKMTLEFFERFDLLRDYKILQIKICRLPISESSRRKISLLGGVPPYEQLKKEFKFDDLYHTFFEMKLERNHAVVDIIYEKNEFPMISNVDKERAKSKCRIIELPNSVITFGKFVDKGYDKMGIEDFFTYNAITNNCNLFMINQLEANHLGTTQDYNFLKQDVLQSIWKKYPDVAESSQKWASRALDFNRFWNGKPDPKNQPEKKLTAGEKAGIAIGTILGVPIVASLGLQLYNEIKKIKNKGKDDEFNRRFDHDVSWDGQHFPVLESARFYNNDDIDDD